MNPIRPDVIASRAQGIWDSYGDRVPRVRFSPPDIQGARCSEGEREAEEEREAFRMVGVNLAYYAIRGHAECRMILGKALQWEGRTE